MTIIDKILNGFKEIFTGKQRRRKKIKKRSGPSKKVSSTVSKKKTAKASKKTSRSGKDAPAKKKAAKTKKKASAGPKTQAIKSAAAKKKKAAVGKDQKKKSHDQLVGEITHYFSKIQVVVVKITKGELRVGDKILIKGKNNAFVQQIKSLQIESVEVKSAKKGKIVGMKVNKLAYVGDQVYLIT